MLLDADEFKRFGDLRLQLRVNGEIRQNMILEGDILYPPVEALQTLATFRRLRPATSCSQAPRWGPRSPHAASRTKKVGSTCRRFCRRKRKTRTTSIRVGPAGLTAATLPAQYGIDCLVLDRHETTYPLPILDATGDDADAGERYCHSDLQRVASHSTVSV